MSGIVPTAYKNSYTTQSSSSSSSSTSSSSLVFSKDAAPAPVLWARRSYADVFLALRAGDYVVVTFVRKPVFSRFFHLHCCDGKDKNEGYISKFLKGRSIIRFQTQDIFLLFKGELNEDITSGRLTDRHMPLFPLQFYECTCNLRKLAAQLIPPNTETALFD